jgi:hypothetical protein
MQGNRAKRNELVWSIDKYCISEAIYNRKDTNKTHEFHVCHINFK